MLSVIIILCLAALTVSVFSLIYAKTEKCNKIISISSLLLSIVAVCCASVRLDFEINDSSAFIASICGIIVLPTTIIIGWNIYQLIDVKNLKDELEKSKIHKQDIQKEIEQKEQRIISLYKTDQIALTQLDRLYNNMPSNADRLFVTALNFFHCNLFSNESVTKTLSYEYAHQLLLTMAERLKTDDEINDFAKKVKEGGLSIEAFNTFMEDYSSQPKSDKIESILSAVKKTLRA